MPMRTVRRACHDSGVDRLKLRWMLFFFTPSERKAFSTTTSLITCVDSGIDSDEGREPLAHDHAAGLHGGADRAGLTGVRVHEHLGAGNARLDVVDLRLERGQVVLRAALEHELLAQLRHARDLDDVLPDV